MAAHVLVPMDASDKATTALEYALEEHPEADLTVIHVNNPVDDTYFASEEDFYTRVEVLETEAEERAEKIFDRAREVATANDSTIETATAIGSPASVIVEYAESEDVDQIVIGSHGRSGVARLLLGSVAETVARRATVPVTIVK